MANATRSATKGQVFVIMNATTNRYKFLPKGGKSAFAYPAALTATGPGVLPRLDQSVPLRVGGALLCACVVAIHVADQGGPTALKDPAYVGYLYYALESAAALATLLLLTRRSALVGWPLALGVAIEPIIGYSVTRTIGLPNYNDDIGNWTEPLGLTSLVVEGLLLSSTLIALAAMVCATSAPAKQTPQSADCTTALHQQKQPTPPETRCHSNH